MNWTRNAARIGSATLAGVAVMTASFLIFRAARAWAAEVFLGTGETVLSYAHALHAERVDEVRVNGLSFRVASGATEDVLGAVLDRFEAACALENADILAQVNSLGHARPAVSRAIAERVRFEGTLRVEQSGRGAVACLSRSARNDSPDIVARLRAFLAAGDVAEIGSVRLFFAAAQTTTTTYVALLSTGKLPLRGAFPMRGDAPGRDPVGVPRPIGGERRLSAWASGTAAAVSVYEIHAATPVSALSGYRDSLARAGWILSTPPDRDRHVIARSGSRAVLASLAIGSGDAALVTIVTL